MICDSAYKPDLLILLNLPNKKQIDFSTCEIKKPLEICAINGIRLCENP